MTNSSFDLFQTDRLSVRRWIETDLTKILEIYGDPDIVRWVGDGTPLTPGQAEKWLVVTRNNYEKRGYGMFTLLDRASREVLGFGGLVHPDNSVQAEVKYAFRKESWGQGLATEFVQGILSYAEEKLKLHEVVATTSPENLASKKVLLKCGFIQEKNLLHEDGTISSFFSRRA